MRYLAILTTMTLVACGGNICSRESCGKEPTDAEIEACETAMEPCNGADQKLMSDYADCIENDTSFCDTAAAASMTADEMASEMDAMAACLEPLAGLSDECKTANGMGGTTGSTGT